MRDLDDLADGGVELEGRVDVLRDAFNQLHGVYKILDKTFGSPDYPLRVLEGQINAIVYDATALLNAALEAQTCIHLSRDE